MRTLAIVPFAVLACSAADARREKLVGGPCEDGCLEVFDGRPAKLAPTARIAPAGEPGEPLAIEGVVRDAAGAPAAGVIVYAYHTDATGHYPPVPGATHRHGKLRAFAQTGAAGTYRFDTIRPASYPNSKLPQHVHMFVVEPGRCYYFIDDLMFADDPLLPATRAAVPRGGDGVATPVNDGSGAWRVRRDIALGAGIHDYARCGG